MTDGKLKQLVFMSFQFQYFRERERGRKKERLVVFTRTLSHFCWHLIHYWYIIWYSIDTYYLIDTYYHYLVTNDAVSLSVLYVFTYTQRAFRERLKITVYVRVNFDIELCSLRLLSERIR